MTADLPQARQQSENEDMTAAETAVGQLVFQILSGLMQEALIELALRLGHITDCAVLNLVRKFLEYISLHSAQDEGSNLFMQLMQQLIAFIVLSRQLICIFKMSAAEHITRQYKIKNGPELS